MQQNNLQVGNKVTFHNDPLPYEVKAVSERYAVCVRPLDKKGDRDLLDHDVKMGGYFSIEEAYDHHKDNPVYTLLDFEAEKRGANNLVFSDYDYWKKEDCEACIQDLINDKVELSHRNQCDLNITSVEFIDETRRPLYKEWPNSSNVASTSFDPTNLTLTIAFKNGYSYRYEAVPNEIWKTLYTCDSIGSFIARNIKGKYTSTKL